MDVWLIDTGRGVPSRFTFDAATDDISIWSPDGSKIAYVSYEGSAAVFQVISSGRLYLLDSGNNVKGPAVTHICTMNADGSNSTCLGEDVGGWHPFWSPDGQHLVFTAGDEHSDIFTASVDGTNVVNLTNDSTDDGYPSW